MISSVEEGEAPHMFSRSHGASLSCRVVLLLLFVPGQQIFESTGGSQALQQKSGPPNWPCKRRPDARSKSQYAACPDTAH